MSIRHDESPTAVTVGNFDGVHKGHAALVAAARRALASRSEQDGQKGRVFALCFDPHPMTVLRPGASPPRLTSFEQRQAYLRRIGVDVVEPLRPTREFLGQSPLQFIEWLVERYRPLVIVEGPDFRFGHGRAGSVTTLREMSSRYGFEVIVVEPVEVVLADQSVVHAASSMVRWLLTRGRVRDARLVLGRPFELCGIVVRGDQRGRTIGVPTANLAPNAHDCLLPADGIYAGLATSPDGAMHPAAISVGTKPSFGRNARTCEAHLIDYHGGLDEYGWVVCIEFHAWLRDQLVYTDANPLVEQIQRDIVLTRAMINPRTELPATHAACLSHNG